MRRRRRRALSCCDSTARVTCVHAAGERQRRRYLADWGNIEGWSPVQVCEYLMTHTVVARCKRQRGIEWQLAGKTLLFVWRCPGTREEHTTEISKELLADGWSRIAAAAILDMLAVALEQGACVLYVHHARTWASWLRATVAHRVRCPAQAHQQALRVSHGVPCPAHRPTHAGLRRCSGVRCCLMPCSL